MSEVSFITRFKAFFIDYVIICAISSLFVISILFYGIKNIYYHSFTFSFVLNLFFCKDLIGGQSIGKRMSKICIVRLDNKDASFFQLILRNLFLFIWPIDLLLCIINPAQKIGDILFRTKVVFYDKERKSMNKFAVLFYFVLTLIVLFCVVYGSFIYIMNLDGRVKLLF